MIKINIDKLETLRLGFDESIRKFAERIGISHQAYIDFKSGNSNPQFDTINKIGKALNLDPKDLIC